MAAPPSYSTPPVLDNSSIIHEADVSGASFSRLFDQTDHQSWKVVWLPEKNAVEFVFKRDRVAAPELRLCSRVIVSGWEKKVKAKPDRQF